LSHFLCIRSAAPEAYFVALKNKIPMILIPPAITSELPGAAVKIVHQQSSVVAGSEKSYVAIATTLPTPSLKAPPLNPPRK
jgi:hypothetical protein